MRKPAPKTCDPWLTPREFAELMLNHKEFPRSTLQIRNQAKKIAGACAAHLTGQPGIVCDRIGRSYRFRMSEGERWNRRRSEKGQAYQLKEACDARR